MEEPFRCSTIGQAPALADKPQAIFERLVMDKRTSLIQKFINYGEKMFNNIGPSGQSPEAYPQNGAPGNCFNEADSGLTRKHQIGWKGLPGTKTLAYFESL